MTHSPVLTAYRLADHLAGPAARLWLARRVKRGKEDETRLGERFGLASVARPPGRLIWFHGASVGEANTLQILIDRLCEREPDTRILMTTGTLTSARLMETRLPEGAVHQFVPLDRRAYVRRFLNHWRPDGAIFAESELWPNLILEARARGCPLALVNARMSEASFKSWRRTPGLARTVLGAFDSVLAQSQTIADRLAVLGAEPVQVTGQLKLAAPAPHAPLEPLIELKGACGDRLVWLAASTHAGEEEVCLNAHREVLHADPRALLIIAPRHPERGAQIAKVASWSRFKVARRSVNQLPTEDTQVYVADTVGEMGVLYRTAHMAFVGGSLVAKGGQNPIEPAKLGCPIVHGPHTANFEEMYALLRAKGGDWRVSSAKTLSAAVSTLAGDESERTALIDGGHHLVANGEAVLETTWAALAPILGCRRGLEE